MKRLYSHHPNRSIRSAAAASPGAALVHSRHQARRRQAIGRACCEPLEGRRLLSFSPAVSFPVGTNPQAVATADFNNDGKLDLATSSYDEATGDGSVSVLLGNGNGGFQPAPSSATGAYPVSLAAGDFNADGKLDLATANADSYNAGVSILLGQGDGTFAAPVGLSAYGEFTNSVAAGDMNADGKLDLVVASGVLDGYVSVLLGHGDGTFADAQPSQEYRPPFYSATLADFNGDGKLDVATTTHESDLVGVFLGNGDGTLQEPRGFVVGPASIFDGPDSLAAADFNADGKIDLATGNTASNSVSMLLGNGDGNFQTSQSFAAGNAPQSATASDVNGDGKFDLVVANPLSTSSPGAVSVLLGNGTGTLGQPITTITSATGGSPSSVVVADFNGDGRPDAAAANTGSNNVSVLLNDGNWPNPPTPPTPPRITINDVKRAEGNSGTTPFTFTVSLTVPSGMDVSVNYATAGGSASSSGGSRDFFGTSGTLHFAAGVTSQTVTVSVVGDTRSESDETFFVNLTQSVNATLDDAQGVGTIVNDESRGKNWIGAASGASWSSASNWSPSGVPTSDSLVTISGASVSIASSTTVSELSLTSNASLSLAAGGNRVLRSAYLYIEDSRLNLNDSDLIVDQGNFSAIRSLVMQGFGAGATTGITSSTSNGSQILALFDNVLVGATQWAGQPIPPTAIVGKYTYFGDANLDGRVTGDDYTIIDASLNTTPPVGLGWLSGDMNLDGNVTGDDYTVIDANLGKGIANPLTPQALMTVPTTHVRASDLRERDGTALVQAVIDP